MKRKIIVVLILLTAVGCGVAYYTALLRPQGMVLTGIVTTDDVVVSAQMQGRIDRLLVKEGDIVKAGQLLAVLQPREMQADEAYYTQTEQSAAAQVSQARAALRYQEKQTLDQVRQAEAALASSEAQVTEAASDLERARLDNERMQTLFNDRIVSAQQLDQTRTTYEGQKARMDSLKRQVEGQRAAVALARSTEEQIQVRREELTAMERQRAAAAAQRNKASVRLDYTEVRAPIAAVVALRAARQGEVVNVGQPIVSLIDPDDFWVRVDVEETYIEQIRIGDRLPVRFPSGAVKEGTVSFRGVDADYATQRDVSRSKRDIKTFEVRLRVDNSDRRIWSGLTAYVELPPPDGRLKDGKYGGYRG